MIMTPSRWYIDEVNMHTVHIALVKVRLRRHSAPFPQRQNQLWSLLTSVFPDFSLPMKKSRKQKWVRQCLLSPFQTAAATGLRPVGRPPWNHLPKITEIRSKVSYVSTTLQRMSVIFIMKMIFMMKKCTALKTHAAVHGVDSGLCFKTSCRLYSAHIWSFLIGTEYPLNMIIYAHYKGFDILQKTFETFPGKSEPTEEF